MRKSNPSSMVPPFSRRLPHLFGLVLLAVICLSWTPFALLLLLFPKSPIRQRIGRGAIHYGFRAYLRILHSLGYLSLSIEGKDQLLSPHCSVIAPNHPSLIDAVILLSLVPGCGCILKADLLRHPLFGAGARLAGYISNESTQQMIKAAVKDLNDGNPILMFPEGTRTESTPIRPLKLSPFVIAKKARVPIRAVVIRCPKGFLSKGNTFTAPDEIPVKLTVTAGPALYIKAGDTRSTAERIEHYFREALSE